MGHIGVVGGGAWGTALACLARRAGRRVTLWSRDPAISTAIAQDRANPVYLPGITLDAGIEATADPESLAACDALLLVCPAQAVREVARHLAGAAPVVICAKGIEASSGLLMPEVLSEVRPGRPIAMLSGPSFAEEAVQGLPTAVSIATADPALGRDAGRGAGGRRVPALLDARRAGRRLGRRGQERAGHRCRHRRGPRPRPQCSGGAGHARLRRNGATGAGDGRRTGDADRAERPRRPGADLPRPAVAQPFAGHGAGQGHVAWPTICRAGGRSSKARRRRPAVLARAARQKIEMPICAAVDAILHKGADLDEAIRALLARPLRREAE